jgi:hypothetical protein
MRRSFTTLLITLCLVSLAVASTQAVTTNKAQDAKPARKIFKGTIDAVTLADATKGTKPEITVIHIQNLKLKVTFLVKSTTTIADDSNKPLTLDKLQKGDKVRIRFNTTPENVHEAISIHLLNRSL